MNNDLAIDERIAAALPEDHPEDFREPIVRNVCSDCNRAFLGRVTRIQCRLCAGRRTV